MNSTKNVTLTTLHPGERGEIQQILSGGGLARRIRDMGIIPGAQVTILGRAPLGDPLALRVADTTVALRKHEAASIVISRIGR